jgi:glycosyltransferase involved in cell wall biosynthesis
VRRRHLSQRRQPAYRKKNGPKRIGFVSTRISGTDGVSLEIEKWAAVLEAMGHSCYYIAGICDDRPPERCHVIPEAHFRHPEIEAVSVEAFGGRLRTPELSDTVRELTARIDAQLRAAIERFDIDVLIAENCLTIPMNIPLGLALVETIMETPVACIAHHHDFVWERDRFLVNCVDDYLVTAFPPRLAQIDHVVINTQAASEFSRRTGLPCTVIPNVMDFDHAPPPIPSRGLRAVLGIGDDDVMVLQPTRIVQRKGIETSIELVRRLDDPRVKLVVSHAAGDEGDDYARRITDYAALLGVELILAGDAIDAGSGGAAGKQATAFSIWDAYAEADLVTYPSTYEGFGNAFLEAVYHGKPILCNRYSIFRTDIEPLGFNTIEIDGYVTAEALAEVRRVLDDPGYRNGMAEQNYRLGLQYFSYRRVATEMEPLLSAPNLISHGLDAQRCFTT